MLGRARDEAGHDEASVLQKGASVWSIRSHAASRRGERRDRATNLLCLNSLAFSLLGDLLDRRLGLGEAVSGWAQARRERENARGGVGETAHAGGQDGATRHGGRACCLRTLAAVPGSFLGAGFFLTTPTGLAPLGAGRLLGLGLGALLARNGRGGCRRWGRRAAWNGPVCERVPSRGIVAGGLGGGCGLKSGQQAVARGLERATRARRRAAGGLATKLAVRARGKKARAGAHNAYLGRIFIRKCEPGR